ncbi:unnamed protein product [Spodoptera exigua]|nr:unnamed protein product [Spodoptera exigua]
MASHCGPLLMNLPPRAPDTAPARKPNNSDNIASHQVCSTSVVARGLRRKCKPLSWIDTQVISAIVKGDGDDGGGEAARLARGASRAAPLMDIDGYGATN